jgi:TonB family protein
MPRSLTMLFKLAPLACACLLIADTRTSARTQVEPQATRPAQVDEAEHGIESYKRGETDEAIKSLRAATKKDKADAAAWYYLGLALVKKGKPKDARVAFETALALRPGFLAARNGQAYALILMGKTYEAMRVADESLKLDPNNAESHYLRGVVHYRLNFYSKALEESENALKLDPSFSDALFLKSQSLVSMSSNALTTANDETPDVREMLLKKIASRLDEATDALDKLSRLSPQNRQNAESLREEITSLRVYSGAPDAHSPDAAIYAPKEVTTKAVITDKPNPSYTERARANEVTGKVRLRMVLAADGRVKYIVAVNRLPDGLTEAAVKAARGIKFVPATKDGRPVSQFVTIEYSFDIY